jgi:hypothetical protein
LRNGGNRICCIPETERSRSASSGGPPTADKAAAEIILRSAVQLRIEDVIRYKLLVIGLLINFFRIRPLHLLGDTGGAEESPGTGAKNLLTNNK